jgi:hypothetical protein
MCETFTNLNNPAREEPMHKIFMEKFLDDTNQSNPLKGDSCVFPFFRKFGVPLMATLYIPGLNVGLPVWLGTIPNVPNSLDASQLTTLCHGHHVDVPSSSNYSLPPSTFSGESLATSNWKSKRNRKRKHRKRKLPTYASHVGDRSSTSTSHVEDQNPTSASHAGGKQPTYAIHVGYRSITFAIHVEDQHPASAGHAGGKITVTASHNSDRSVASASYAIDHLIRSASHAGDAHPTSTSHVGEKHPTYVSHARGKHLVTAGRTSDRSVASTIHVINQSPTSTSHVGDLKPTIASHARGINYVEKHRRIRHNPKFPSKICKRDQLTHLCPGLPEAQRLWSLSAISFDFDSSKVSLHSIQPLVDEVVMLMQSLTDPTPPLGGDAPSNHVVS